MIIGLILRVKGRIVAVVGAAARPDYSSRTLRV